ncbi:EAL domain-containing protein [Arsukibacterium perlucidum]|uniref:EAL domain-containing protein n=1 Tax=Arsukibacterium perlucidum TaxID=368811 RepID=UPI0003744C49|nr:bifunctional diguanylate cyclase/phosphodiesterase [Arsukibacterium perlucidum]
MLSRIKQLLLLTEDDLGSTSVNHLQQSTLRIILSSGLLLVLSIAVHSSWQAYQAEAWYIIGITSGFYLTLLLALYFSAKSLALSKILLLFTVFGAGLCMLLFIDNFELSKLGVIFVYTAPVIAMLFFSRTMTIIVMLLNIIPYLFLMFGSGPISLFNISIILPSTPAYLHSLLFLFFNLCIPLAVMRVISTLKRNAVALKQQNDIISQSNNLYEDIFDHQAKATLLVNSHGAILKANTKAKSLLRIDEAADHNIKDLLKVTDNSQSCFWLGHEAECTLQATPSIHILLNHLCRTQQHHIVQLDNITPLKELHQKLTSNDQKQNLWRNYDTLTALPEQNFFLQLVKQYGECKAGSLMVIVRLANIKAFNHAHSYQAGDELLAVFARDFQLAFIENTLTARLRGVKFILWRPMPEHSTSFSDEVLTIQRLLPKQLSLSTGILQPMYEMGVSISNHTLATPELMLEQCEAALESADAYTRPISYYQADILEQRNQQLKLLAAFKKALQLDTPTLWLQPKVKPDGTIISFEALLRWQDNDGNFIAPDNLVTLAEQYGFIVQLSLSILAKAITIIKLFQQQSITYPVAINLTGSDLLCDEFYNTLIDIATHQPQLLSMLSLELTENSVVRHQQPLFNKLLVLTRLGYVIALDDFGTGQASLSTLSQLPVSTIKLDRTFLQNIPADQRQTQLIQSVMQMAKTLKLAVIIEGVETDIQRRFLQSLGAQMMQGYYFSRPLPVDHWLRQLSGFTTESSFAKPQYVAAE